MGRYGSDAGLRWVHVDGDVLYFRALALYAVMDLLGMLMRFVEGERAFHRNLDIRIELAAEAACYHRIDMVDA